MVMILSSSIPIGGGAVGLSMKPVFERDTCNTLSRASSHGFHTVGALEDQVTLTDDTQNGITHDSAGL